MPLLALVVQPTPRVRRRTAVLDTAARPSRGAPIVLSAISIARPRTLAFCRSVDPRSLTYVPLELDQIEPESTLRALVGFTFDYQNANESFIRVVMMDRLRRVCRWLSIHYGNGGPSMIE